MDLEFRKKVKLVHLISHAMEQAIEGGYADEMKLDPDSVAIDMMDCDAEIEKFCTENDVEYPEVGKVVYVLQKLFHLKK